MFHLWVAEIFFLKSLIYFTLQEIHQNTGTHKAHVICHPKPNKFCSHKDDCYQVVFKSILTTGLWTYQLLETAAANVIFKTKNCDQ